MLITSRNRLSGLVAREGAQPVALDVLDEQAAVDLLTERIRAARVAAEPEAVSRLVKRCAGLPLALGIVAARAAYGDSLTALADELELERLDALDIDDPMTGIRGVFSWSLRNVSETAARVFVLLGLHPGPDFSIAAAASLAALPLAEAQRALHELVAGSLVATTSTGRYLLHDLLRDYAAERVGELPEVQRSEALHRMFDHYLHTSLEANQRIEIRVHWTPLAPPSPSAVVVPMPDVRAAREWENAERRVVPGVVAKMVAAGADDLAWRLGYTLHLHLLRRGQLADVEALELMALAAAQRLGDVFGRARLHRSLGGVYIAQEDFDKADHHLSSALRCEVELGNPNTQADVSRGLAFVYEMQGRHADALDILTKVHATVDSLNTYQRACHLAALGRAHHRAGEAERGLELCLRADEAFDEAKRDVPSMPMSTNWETKGDIHLDFGRYPEAVDCYREAVRLLRTMSQTIQLAYGLVRLAKAHIAAGESEAARPPLVEAVSIYEALDRKDAAEVRSLLEGL
ncbi:hypothetical protein FXN61_14150 [Lentzea sp. PSKA42]|uniref:Tetratricopeptide repeat-containing protein n=1 Tax=Lentzea indica TaxID=2604800 RepID=A0ABX1FGG3_9PSEU|nr:hypothetical protein [Lentzea indica]